MSAAIVSLTLSLPSARAADAAPASRPRVGLVLSGGGARGAAHIGVLQVLERHRVPVDVVAGTSMGALVGGLYASGLSPAQLDSVIRVTDWNLAFADNIPRADRSFHRNRDDDQFLVKHKPGLRGGAVLFPSGLLDGQRVDLLLKRLSFPVVAVRDFDRLATPYRAVAADIVTGERVVLEGGDLALAMRSSMSIPGAFAPREVDGHLLVDGGIVDNFPIELARRMGADVIVAVDISTPAPDREQFASVATIATQLAVLASEQEKRRQVATLAGDDVLITPPLGTITVASFDRAAEAVPIGARAAEDVAERLDRLALPPAEYAAWRAARDARGAQAARPPLAALRIVNHSRLADAVLAARLRARVGAPLALDPLERDLDQVYGLELFQSVYWDVTPGPAGDTLTVTARERAWGPNYLQAGVVALEDFEHPNFNLALAYDRTAIDRYGGEWRTGVQVGQEPGVWTQLHQPLDRTLRSFVELDARYGERALNRFATRGEKLGEIAFRRAGAEFAAGRELGTWAEVRAGLAREGGRSRMLVGTPNADVGAFDTGEAFAQLFVDRLDEMSFPHRGGLARARWTAGLTGLGSNADYRQLDAEACGAATRGGWTGALAGWLGTTLTGEAPLTKQFCLGGLGQLSGLEQDERTAPNALLLRATLQRRVVDLPVLPTYVGLTGEYGETFASRASVTLAHGVAAGSVFVGLDTMVGPLCVAFGLAEGGRTNYYLTLGQPLGGHRPGFRVY